MKPALDRKLHTRAALLEVLATGSWLAGTGKTDQGGLSRVTQLRETGTNAVVELMPLEFVCWMDTNLGGDGAISIPLNQGGYRQQTRIRLQQDPLSAGLNNNIATHCYRNQAHHSSSGDAIGVCDVGTGRQRNTQVDGTSTLSQQG